MEQKKQGENANRSTRIYEVAMRANQTRFSTTDDIFDAHNQMMQVALADAGRWCYGIKAIEVWITTDKGHLVKAEAGSWIDPVYLMNEDPVIKNCLMALYDPKSPDFDDLKKLTFAPGEGLPGALWADTNGKVLQNVAQPLDLSSSEEKNVFSNIKWRDVKALAEDPDQPYSHRLKIVAKAGFARAAGVPFNSRGLRGIVIFMARRSVRMRKLSSRLNEEYMQAAALHLGSVQGLRQPRRFAAVERRREARRIFKRAKMLIKKQVENGEEGTKANISDVIKHEIAEIEEVFHTERFKKLVQDKLKALTIVFKRWAQKMRGAGVAPPPGMPLNSCIFVLFAAFLTCFIMAWIHTEVLGRFGVGFELGQVASVTTMAYILTASPAAQPRSIILGRLLSMFVGMVFAEIPGNSDVITWIRFGGSVSVATALMGKLGLAHPPGGALAWTFVKYSFDNPKSYEKIGILVLQDVIFVLLAASINNWSHSKSYPTYWGHLPNLFSSAVRKACAKKFD